MGRKQFKKDLEQIISHKNPSAWISPKTFQLLTSRAIQNKYRRAL
jgi:hypothetical protein